ncbi:MAG TPA: hypothetical protein P5013_01270 [Methanoregula sp.]|nr:hypothetical protein [Methanoregula sp.]
MSGITTTRPIPATPAQAQQDQQPVQDLMTETGDLIVQLFARLKIHGNS